MVLRKIASNNLHYLSNSDLIKCKTLTLGITFKESCLDTESIKVIGIYSEWDQFESGVTVYNPCGNIYMVKNEYGISILNEITESGLDNAIILARAHNEFLNLNYKRIKKQQRYF